ncbi:MAG: SDR family oxidoreductase [Vicinamibacteria bacterium]
MALSGVLGYSVAKAAVESFTRWMAVDLARRFGDGLRVNAIAPGFFVAKQNRAALVQDDGTPTERARKILARTPMGRFGDPGELRGPILWLCSDAASFVTGAVIPVDGGFSADGGIPKSGRPRAPARASAVRLSAASRPSRSSRAAPSTGRPSRPGPARPGS